jgi:hypothetical protein
MRKKGKRDKTKWQWRKSSCKEWIKKENKEEVEI